MKNYYDILGITKSASEREIKSAFRELAKKTHPDKNPNTREKFIEIFEAYHILINNTENISEQSFSPRHQDRTEEQGPSDSTGLTRYRSEAEQYADMKYDDFIKSSIMKGVSAIKLFLTTVAVIGYLGIYTGFIGVLFFLGFYGLLGLFGKGEYSNDPILQNLFFIFISSLIIYSVTTLIFTAIQKKVKNEKGAKKILLLFNSLWKIVKDIKEDKTEDGNKIILGGVFFFVLVIMVLTTLV